ncbi:hypothetical protein KM043_001645 [Ampulex compressa]|nr:hypothetical protein KM043_001645 [Ampulex compressa]
MKSYANVLLTFTRTYLKRTHKSWKVDKVKYGLVSYYPRTPDHVDPPIVPSKILMVERLTQFRGNPYWHKRTLLNVGFSENNKTNERVVVKNTPEMCALLWSIKHLVKVTPVKLPEKMPGPDDMAHTFLHENGTFEVIPKISPERIEATDKHLSNPKRLEADDIQHKIRLKWLHGTLI